MAKMSALKSALRGVPEKCVNYLHHTIPLLFTYLHRFTITLAPPRRYLYHQHNIGGVGEVVAAKL